MAKGYYNVSYKLEGDTKEKTDLIFELNIADGRDIPDDQQNLVIDLGNTITTISILYESNKIRFSNSLEQLLFIAKIGLEGDNAQPALASKALLQFKKEIVDKESGKVKNNYLRSLGVKAAILGVPFFISGMLINYLVCLSIHCDCIKLNYISNFMILWSGTMAGVWLSFAVTRTNIGFDDLAIIEKDRLEPAIRLLFTGILSVIFGLFFVMNSFEIKLGNLSSHNIINSPITALLIGTILGLNEKVIGSTLTKKTSDAIK